MASSMTKMTLERIAANKTTELAEEKPAADIQSIDSSTESNLHSDQTVEDVDLTSVDKPIEDINLAPIETPEENTVNKAKKQKKKSQEKKTSNSIENLSKKKSTEKRSK
jgi:hypothetical protein